MKKILVFLAKGFELMEFSVFIDIPGWAGADFGQEIRTETCGFRRQVTSAFGVPVTVDKTIDEASAEDYDALAIPGGFEAFGFYEEAYDGRFLELVRAFDRQGKHIAAVCVAALALGKSGILEGRRATTYHLMEGRRQAQLAAFGAVVINEPVVEDGNVVTSYCPETAPRVAFRLLERLIGAEEALAVKRAMGF